MESLRDHLKKLDAQKRLAREMGGEEAVRKQHESGKLTARERVDLLFDPGSFWETGVLATHHSALPDMKNKVTPADGVVTGVGKLEGRPVCVAAYDFTVMAGTMGEVGERKVARMRELALRERIPMVWLLDSAGARIQEVAGAQFAGTGDLFYEQVQMSGLVPMVAAVMGPTAAGTAYIPALADFVPMVKGTSSMALAGPPLVKAAINEDVTTEELGGSLVHCKISGVADLETENDAACISAIRQYLSFMPSRCGEKPSLKPPRSVSAKTDDLLGMSDGVLDLLPSDPRKGYDMKKLLAELLDEGFFFEMKPEFAKNILTGFGRIAGQTVGLLANQPAFMGGVIDIDAADKATRFLSLCNAFEIPVVFLHDCPGFMVGSRMEKLGIIRHGAKMLFAVSELTVPKLAVVIRRSYGAGYYVMCGKGYQPDLLVAWPGSEIGLMSPEGAVNIAFRREIEGSEDPKAALEQRVLQYRRMIGSSLSASQGHLDDVIDPRDTRRVLHQALTTVTHQRRERPAKKQGVYPV
jgi:acetyl-CoA carboxylase carboxyltransferase component